MAAVVAAATVTNIMATAATRDPVTAADVDQLTASVSASTSIIVRLPAVSTANIILQSRWTADYTQ
jgi:hypothetical protein